MYMYIEFNPLHIVWSYWRRHNQQSSELIDSRIVPGEIRGHYSNISRFLLAAKMLDIKAWAEYVVEWAAKDPYGFLTTVILALTPLFLASAVLSWKLAKMIEAREKEQKKKQKRQENIAKAKRLKKDWRGAQTVARENPSGNSAALEGLSRNFQAVPDNSW